MDRLMFQEIRQLSHVLSSYYSNTMDELAKDLNNALEEASGIRIHEGKVRSKTWKCRSKPKSGMIFGSSTLKYSTKSEDSESSLDNWPQLEMDISRRGSYHCTDSDDILCKFNQYNHHLASWRHSSTNLGESDSVNESLYPLREPRRKRKFKRMAIDPPTVTEYDFSKLSNVPFCTPKSKRLRNLKSQNISKLSLKSPKHSKLTVSELSAEMENICKDFGNTCAATGKRKRCAHEKSIECCGCECKDILSHKSEFSSSCHHLKSDITTKSHDINSNGLSSSESECGVLTNDESREADDEQSDFFQEPEPSYGIPSFSPWWQDDDLMPDEKKIFDPKFQDILSKSFQHMSEAAKKMYKMQVDNCKVGRQIRSGRRRLGKGLTPRLYQKMISPDDLYMPLTNEFDCFSLPVDNCLTKASPNEKKKRKGMTPSTGTIHGVEELIPCITESNVGFQASNKMSWKSGTGLGPIGEGIISPVKTSVSYGKQGLAFFKRNSENIHSTPPPPPPSSPQPFLTQNESFT